MISENPTDHVFVDLDAEGQSDLMGNPLAAPCAITPFHLNDRVDQFSCRTFRSRTAGPAGREQQPVLLFRQHFVKMQQSRGLQDDSRAQNSRGTHQ
jgi:hypothetical protein